MVIQTLAAKPANCRSLFHFKWHDHITLACRMPNMITEQQDQLNKTNGAFVVRKTGV